MTFNTGPGAVGVSQSHIYIQSHSQMNQTDETNERNYINKKTNTTVEMEMNPPILFSFHFIRSDSFFNIIFLYVFFIFLFVLLFFFIIGIIIIWYSKNVSYRNSSIVISSRKARRKKKYSFLKVYLLFV